MELPQIDRNMAKNKLSARVEKLAPSFNLGDVVRLKHSPAVWMTVDATGGHAALSIGVTWLNKLDNSVHRNMFLKEMLVHVPQAMIDVMTRRIYGRMQKQTQRPKP